MIGFGSIGFDPDDVQFDDALISSAIVRFKKKVAPFITRVMKKIFRL